MDIRILMQNHRKKENRLHKNTEDTNLIKLYS